ncbi:MAG: cytochrome P450 [Miltoncostaeaceae bacterium]
MPVAPGPRRSRNPYRWLRPRHGDRLAGLTRAAREHGPVARIPHGPVWIHLVTDPELVREVLVTRADDFTVGRKLRATRRFLGDGLLGSEGELHRRQRALVAPAFHRESVERCVRVIVARTERALDDWGPERATDLRAEMTRIARDVMANVAWGEEPRAAPPPLDDLTPMIDQLEHATSPAGRIAMRLPTPSVRRARGAAERSRAGVEAVIARRRAEGGEGDDLLSMLLAARGEDGRPLPDDLVRDELRTLFLAGQESVANTMAWTIWLVATHPEIARGIREEATGVMAAGPLTARAVPFLGRARRAVQEAMRIYPPAWAVGRTAVRESRVGRWALPRGANVLVSPWVTHRDPDLWRDPLSFDPERFAEDGDRPEHPFAYFPFCGGARTCIGSSLAMTETTIVLAMLLARYDVAWAGDGPPVPQPQITLRPQDGAPILARRFDPPDRPRIQSPSGATQPAS